VDRKILLCQARKLAALGLTVERERSKLKRLVERGIPYDDQKMLQALNRFKVVDFEWKQLETEHLQLKKLLTEKISARSEA